jgi:hypothetical protein
MRVRFRPDAPDLSPEGRGLVVAPQARGEGVYDVVAEAAQVAGAKADAVVDIDRAEHLRRARCGLGGVETLGLLDALMCLPHGEPNPVVDLGEVALWHLRRAPEGCVQWLAGGRAVRAIARAPSHSVHRPCVCRGQARRARRSGRRRSGPARS